MLMIDKDGWLVSNRVQVIRRPKLAHGRMTHVAGIIVHQTGAPTAQSSLNSYLHAGANGAHFLIDRDGTIFQTGSLLWKQWHVGKLRARCLMEQTCSPKEAKALKGLDVSKTNQHENLKAVPNRFPSNNDAIGIELVAGVIGGGATPAYEAATPQQNASLSWLVASLRDHFHVPPIEVFRHPQVSYKDPHEAESAKW